MGEEQAAKSDSVPEAAKPQPEPSAQEAPEQKPSSSVETVKMATDQVINRRSRWVSSAAALRYVSSIQRDNEVRVRDSDKATAIALLLCCVFALVCLLVRELEQYRVPFVLVSDVLVGASLLMYVANRFGIVTTFQPRQALLTWQLMLGSCLLGVFMTINMALVIAWLMQNNTWISLR